MFRLRTGYVLLGIILGVGILFSFIWSLPDGKLRIVFCDVGQGDAAYVRFPDGRDMLVDGGPNNRVLSCLGRYMPFWDRSLDMVVLTHPQADHMNGIIEVLRRFQVGHLVRSDIAAVSRGYQELETVILERNVPVRYMSASDRILVGRSTLSILWPTSGQIAHAVSQGMQASVSNNQIGRDVLSTNTGVELNDYSIVFSLRYGSFDALFTGDADSRVDNGYAGSALADDAIEVLKVSHHGSKTGMSETFLKSLYPSEDVKGSTLDMDRLDRIAVISVGKNSYGHPRQEVLDALAKRNVPVYRTDKGGDIQVTSDGNNWTVRTSKK